MGKGYTCSHAHTHTHTHTHTENAVHLAIKKNTIFHLQERGWTWRTLR